MHMRWSATVKPERLSRDYLDELYYRYNHKQYISPDPLEFVWLYNEPSEREIVGLIASALAYGRVAQIKKSVSGVLEKMGPSPRSFIEGMSRKDLVEIFAGFRHRFTTCFELADFIIGIQKVIRSHGSLERCFSGFLKPCHDSTISALGAFVEELRAGFPRQYNSLLPYPEKKSACKRLHLFLRWMVRQDNVDPGVWSGISPKLLIIPLDTHMFGICSGLGMTCRLSPDIKTALEITSCFRGIIPDDPVKYDFSLTRLGIRPDVEKSMDDSTYSGGNYHERCSPRRHS